MSIIRATLTDLAKLLGLSSDAQLDCLTEERSARAALTRRGLFKAAGAVAGGLAFSEGLAERFAVGPTITIDLVDYQFRSFFVPAMRLMFAEELHESGLISSPEFLRILEVDHQRGTITFGSGHGT